MRHKEKNESVTIEGKVTGILAWDYGTFGSKEGLVISIEQRYASDSPVETLIIDRWWWPIERGDYIRAKISMVKSYIGPFRRIRPELKKTEKPSVIEIIRDNEVVATYRN